MSRGRRSALALVTDAYGGRGGIALYSRNLLQALCSHPDIGRVVAIPRKVVYDLEEMPTTLEYLVQGAGTKLRFVATCLHVLFRKQRFDLVVCGHIHLLPIACALSLLYRCPLITVIYGVEAWTPTGRVVVDYLCRRLKSVISIRNWTTERFSHWTGNLKAKYYYLPNCIDPAKYGIRPPRSDLVERYKLSSKKVVMTVGRLDAGMDLNKGFDEVLEVLPRLLTDVPELAYLIVGDGVDRARLERKATDLGVARAVIFTGYVSESEKADYYRLADVFAMPGSNPDFDRYPFRFVFLEALACGIPVIGSRPESASEASDPDSALIVLVDPRNKKELKKAILAALSVPHQIRPELKGYYLSSFGHRLNEIIDDVLSRRSAKLRGAQHASSQ